MKSRRRILTTAILAASVAVTGLAFAASQPELIAFSAAGACQSNNPATNDIRVRVGGMINVGAPNVYIVCSSPETTEQGDTKDGITEFQIKLSNTTASQKTINCTFSPGWTTAVNGSTTFQGSFPKSLVLEANSSWWLVWTRTEVVGAESTDEITAPNIICLTPQGTMVHYLIYYRPEEIGA